MILRAIVVVLLCLNLGVGLWWALQRETVVVVPPAGDDGTGSLVLLGEAEPPPPPDQAEVGAVPVPMPAQVACLTLGPFATPAELRVAMNALTPQVARIQFREVAGTELRGYRVYLPAAGDRGQALAAARQLAAKGVRDYYVVTAGADENTVSLGIFRDLANAETRRDEIAAMGFQPVLEPRTSDGALWWIDLAAEPGFAWKTALAGRDGGLEAKDIACQ